ncbi:cobalamin biosynthesis protein [Salipiger bermudensis]|uniref:Cobalamin biosynthesis domain protein n=1 Tax=Salipiger bermudensis (strain DSM 26914 / JCM 13377 / KCTC 12554 / HTCC2601) TaxID=314265 RepID=Q0FSL6_SALBH|nr:cobalamin biosynthesis protein [Salipiger bermudensis]EAU47237.1 cobalamin biosynthesis domain protein [Salipiger bermudensis HTCC2601]
MIVAGFGFRAGVSAQSLADALALTGAAPDALATAEDKAAHPAFRALAHALNLPVHALPAAALDQPTATRSAASLAARGTGSLAEAAALAVVGPRARLLAPRQISPDRMATCAIATGDPE